MVSTRRRGSPGILMLDDHENPVQQSSVPLAKSIQKSPGKQTKKPVKESTKPQQSEKQAETKSTRNTRQNPDPHEEGIIVSEPEKLLHRKTQKHTHPPKSTKPQKDVFNLPSSDGERETDVISKSRQLAASLRSSKSGTIKTNVKGKEIVLKGPKPKPVSTVEVEAAEQNEGETNGEGEEPEITTRGDDGDDERDEDYAADEDFTLEEGQTWLDIEILSSDEAYGPTTDPKEPERRLGEPFEEQPGNSGIRVQKAKKQDDGKKQKKKKRRKDVGTFHGDYEDDSESDQDILRTMTIQELEEKISSRAIAMEQEYSITFSNVENDRKSIDRRLMALEESVMDKVDEFNDRGIYNEVFRGGKHHDRYKPLPRVIAGDPFPDGAADFDANDPRFKKLFTDEKTAYEVDIFNDYLDHINTALVAANKLHRISEKIWLTSTKYKTILTQQKKFVETCRDHAQTVKARYIARRTKEAERAKILRADRMAKEERFREAELRRKQYLAKYSAANVTPSRKRPLDVPDTIDAKRQKTHQQNRLSGEYQPPATEPESEPESESESEPESDSLESPQTPPPTDRVVIELFGDHTPGRTRRINRNPEDANDQAVGQSGIHEDNAPWTAEENDALDAALRAFQNKNNRWHKIKQYFGYPGTVLAERSAEEIRDKAREYKTRIKNSGQILPDYWELVDYSSDEAGA